MKRKFLLYTLSAGIAVLTFSSYGSGPFNGGAGNHTGSAGSQANCSTGSGCHATNTSNTTVSINLFTQSNGSVTAYTPGTSYKVVISATNTSGLPRYGFQASCVKAAATSTQAGTFSGTPANVSIRTSSGLQLVEHNTPIAATASSGGLSTYVMTFNWTAPAAGTGTVRFYATLNAINFTGSSSGDQPNTAIPADYPESTTGIGSIAALPMSVYPNPATSTLHLKIDGATGNTCSLQIWDMSGRLAASQHTAIINGEAVADINRLSPGNYYVLAIKDGKQYIAPFIKN